ncbi:MAG: hypothetical protein LZF61_02540 [Nitrosomonas sp.]|nr:MAG: hypothetical protein LZF61_02540 [Nitrosomonas sp.]
MASPIYNRKELIKKNVRALSLFLVISIVSACAHTGSSSVAAPAGISNNDHEALAQYYDGQAQEARARLRENKKILKEYEDHPYYFGRKGLEIQSHASANIREYEKDLRENQSHANFHRKMALELKNSNVINKAKANQDRDFTSKSTEHSVSKGL